MLLTRQTIGKAIQSIQLQSTTTLGKDDERSLFHSCREKNWLQALTNETHNNTFYEAFKALLVIASSRNQQVFDRQKLHSHNSQTLSHKTLKGGVNQPIA